MSLHHLEIPMVDNVIVTLNLHHIIYYLTLCLGTPCCRRKCHVNSRTQAVQTAIVKAPPLQNVDHLVISYICLCPKLNVHMQETVIVAIMLEEGGGKQEAPLAVLRPPPNP